MIVRFGLYLKESSSSANNRIWTFDFKDGDIVVIDVEKIYLRYINFLNIRKVLSSLDKVQRIYLPKEPVDYKYFIKIPTMVWGGTCNLRDGDVLRKATDDEVDEFLRKERIEKFNV